MVNVHGTNMIIVKTVSGLFEENTKKMLIIRKVNHQYMDLHAHLGTFQSDNFQALIGKPHLARNKQINL